MNETIANDLRKSSKQFKDIIIPELIKIFSDSQYEIVEGVTIEEFAKMLDTLAGIDVWQIEKNRGIRGIASRIQPSDYNHKTFTVRKERESGASTEYEKRKFAIENDYLYPYFTLQAYLTKDGKLLDFACAKTTDVMDMIDKGLCYVNGTNEDKIGQATFFVVDWDEMIKNGYQIYIHSKKIIVKKEKQTSLYEWM